MEPAWAERLTILHNRQVRRWRLSSLWIDANGTAGDSEIIVIDAGSAGLWEVLPDAEDVGQVTFATRRFVDILEMLQGL